MGGSRASKFHYVLYIAGALTYALAILDRGTLAVAGVTAIDRFGISPGFLSLLGIAQIGIYGLMQLPTGLLLDRIGPRAVLPIGAVLMSVGQLMMAASEDVGMAVAARVVVGIGDALTFVTVVRITDLLFHGRSASFLVQFIGVIGQLGQFTSAVPFAYILRTYGWTLAFGGASALGFLLAAVLFVLFRHRMAAVLGKPSSKINRVPFRTASKSPGVMLGFWVHFTLLFPAMSFTIVWGYTYIQEGEGLSPVIASSLFVILTSLNLVTGPSIGMVVSRFPGLRMALVSFIIGIVAAAWSLAILWPGQVPFGILVLLGVSISLCGPGSLVGFDLVRTHAGDMVSGISNGIVNSGGYLASLISVGLVGAFLTLGLEVFDMSNRAAFRFAMSSHVILWTVGIVGIVIFSRRHRKFWAR